MTIIAAYSNGVYTAMASDIAVTNGHTFYTTGGKLLEFHVGDERVLLGGAGNASVLTAVQYGLSIEAVPANADFWSDADEWANEVARGVTKLLHEAEPSITTSADNDNAGGIDGIFLLAWRHHIWLLFTHGAMRSADGFAAIGSGAEVAIGALATLDMNLSGTVVPRTAVKVAVELASRYAHGCRIGDDGPIIKETS